MTALALLVALAAASAPVPAEAPVAPVAPVAPGVPGVPAPIATPEVKAAAALATSKATTTSPLTPTLSPADAGEREPGLATTSTSTSTPTSTSTQHPASRRAPPTPGDAAPHGLADVAAATARAESHVGPGASTPPALTSRALTDELRRAASERRAERAGVDAERKHLEALDREIGKSRAALKDETARLQALLAAGVAQGGGKPGHGGRAASAQSPIDQLAKTVKGMRPDQAAVLLVRLDRGLAAGILSRMRPADAALVLDKIDPGAGADLLALLARSAAR